MAAQNMMTLTDEEMNIILLLRQSSQSTQQAVYTLLNATANNNNDPNTDHDLQLALELSNQHQSRPSAPSAPSPHVGMNLNNSDRDLQLALRLSNQDQERQAAATPPHVARIAQTHQDHNFALQLQQQEVWPDCDVHIFTHDAHSHAFQNKDQEDYDEELLQNMLEMGLGTQVQGILQQRSINLYDPTLDRQRSRRRSEPVALTPRNARNRNMNRERNDCTICLEQYQGRERKRVLPCMHVFHKDCIDAWTNRHRTCPICRTNV
eukprot:592243_1